MASSDSQNALNKEQQPCVSQAPPSSHQLGVHHMSSGRLDNSGKSRANVEESGASFNSSTPATDSASPPARQDISDALCSLAETATANVVKEELHPERSRGGIPGVGMSQQQQQQQQQLPQQQQQQPVGGGGGPSYQQMMYFQHMHALQQQQQYAAALNANGFGGSFAQQQSQPGMMMCGPAGVGFDYSGNAFAGGGMRPFPGTAMLFGPNWNGGAGQSACFINPCFQTAPPVPIGGAATPAGMMFGVPSSYGPAGGPLWSATTSASSFSAPSTAAKSFPPIAANVGGGGGGGGVGGGGARMSAGGGGSGGGDGGGGGNTATEEGLSRSFANNTHHHNNNSINSSNNSNGDDEDVADCGPKRRAKGYWLRFSNVRRELMRAIEILGCKGHMPTMRQLRARGFVALIHGLYHHGGAREVAVRLGLEPPMPALVGGEADVQDRAGEDLAVNPPGSISSASPSTSVSGGGGVDAELTVGAGLSEDRKRKSSDSNKQEAPSVSSSSSEEDGAGLKKKSRTVTLAPPPPKPETVEAGCQTVESSFQPRQW